MHLISDFCNRISQSSKMNLKQVIVQYSVLILSSLNLLVRFGFINSFRKLSLKHFCVDLKYFLSQSVIRALFSISRPSLKLSVKYKKIENHIFKNSPTLNGFVAFLTNRGLNLDLYCILLKIGGFPLWAVN